MRIHESGEDYLETILKLMREKGNVRSVDIVTELNYSKSSVSRAVGILKTEGLIEVDASGYILFTGAGLKRAEDISERHATLTQFLNKLGVDAENAERDACKIEHDLSTQTYAAIKRFLER